jgi:hypothetical protein
MTTRDERTGATPDPKPNFGNRRRAPLKDTLMPDEPPRVLGFAIPLVAVLFILLLVTLRVVEYQDAVRVSLTLKTKDSFGRAYGEAYLQQGDAATVRAEQIVDIDLGAYGGAKSRRLQAKVGDIAAFDVHPFYRVRVDLPPEFDVNTLSSAPPGPIQVEAKILTQKKTLFDKLFGSFRAMSRNL